MLLSDEEIEAARIACANEFAVQVRNGEKPKTFARAIEALLLAKLGAQEPVVHQHGFAKENATLRTINESLDKQLDEVMRERDERDDVIDKLLDLVLGEDRYEWSSHYGFAEAIEEVEERMATTVQAQSEPVAYMRKDGMKAMVADEKSAWIEAGNPDIVEDYTLPLFSHPAPVQQEPVAWLPSAEWTPCRKLPVTVHVRKQREGETHVSTREGITPVKPDDLIMRGVQGEEYPIDREIFERTYRIGEAAPVQQEPTVKEYLTVDEPIGYYSKTGHGIYYRETLTPEIAELTHGGVPMWKPMFAAPVQQEGTCPHCGSDCNERDELIKAEREIERLERLLTTSSNSERMLRIRIVELEAQNKALLGALKWLDRWMGDKQLLECANKVRAAIAAVEKQT